MKREEESILVPLFFCDNFIDLEFTASQWAGKAHQLDSKKSRFNLRRDVGQIFIGTNQMLQQHVLVKSTIINDMKIKLFNLNTLTFHFSFRSTLFFPILIFALNSFCQSYPRTEILIGLSSQDNSIPFGNGHFTDSIKAHKGVNSSSNLGVHLILKFYKSANTAFRIKTQYMNKNITQNYETFSPSYVKENRSMKQNILRVAPGFQWGFQQERVEFFAGLELPIAYVGNSSFESSYELAYQSNPSQVIYSSSITSLIPGGFAIAGGLFFGSTFHVNKFLVLGFELNGNYGFTKTGGSVSNNYKTTFGTGSTFYHQSYEEVMKQINYSSIQANFSIGINF